MIDDRDRFILSVLQSEGRVPNAEIARRIGMAPSAVLERIRKLEARGAIQGYEARVDPRTLGLALTAFAYVTVLEPLGQGGLVAARAVVLPVGWDGFVGFRCVRVPPRL